MIRGRATRRGRLAGRRIAAPAIAALLAGALATPLAAQWPGGIRGTVTDALTGAPVAGARVELPALGVADRTGGDGAFALQGLEPGARELRVTAAGYAERRETVVVRNGAVARLDVALAPVVELDPVRGRARRDGPGFRIAREEIAASGARTVADVVDRFPGVVVRRQGAGPATASIRGSDPAQVLVLLDGAVLNDPVTGAADLSRVPAALIEAVTVQPGAASARHGPGAVAGVILLESRPPGPRVRVASALGSLGERRGSLDLGAAPGPLALQATLHAARTAGRFAFDQPAEAGGGSGVRANADAEEVGAMLSAEAALGPGLLRAIAAGDRLRRGLPGRGYAPSPHARQELDRLRASAAWRGAAGPWTSELRLHATDDRLRHADSLPPAGLPYDDRARLVELSGELVVGGDGGSPVLDAWTAGARVSRQRVRSDALDGAAPPHRTLAGAFVQAVTRAPIAAGDATLTLTGRVDRAGDDALHPGFAAAAALTVRAVRVHAAARSGYRPPSLADQFFREGVAVAPNPGLRGERVPLELELGVVARRVVGEGADGGAAGTHGGAAGAILESGLTAFRGDIRDMIVWAPDFRFVWSPRNTDVHRWGGEAWARVALPRGLEASLAYALAVVTYDRPGATGDQLAYRPRHTGRAAVEWRRDGWRAAVAGDYIGARYPTAARVNRLPPFWRSRLTLAREWRSGDWRADAALHVDRLLDETDALIYGYPEPGRTFQLRLDLAREGGR